MAAAVVSSAVSGVASAAMWPVTKAVDVMGLSEVNMSTLSGAIDIVVIKHPDGRLKSSPFHVRFGKMQIVYAKDKVVKIQVNGKDVRLKMKLGTTGEAFFVNEADTADINSDLLVSPLMSPRRASIDEKHDHTRDRDVEIEMARMKAEIEQIDIKLDAQGRAIREPAAEDDMVAATTPEPESHPNEHRSRGWSWGWGDAIPRQSQDADLHDIESNGTASAGTTTPTAALSPQHRSACVSPGTDLDATQGSWPSQILSSLIGNRLGSGTPPSSEEATDVVLGAEPEPADVNLHDEHNSARETEYATMTSAADGDCSDRSMAVRSTLLAQPASVDSISTEMNQLSTVKVANFYCDPNMRHDEIGHRVVDFYSIVFRAYTVHSHGQSATFETEAATASAQHDPDATRQLVVRQTEAPNALQHEVESSMHVTMSTARHIRVLADESQGFSTPRGRVGRAVESVQPTSGVRPFIMSLCGDLLSDESSTVRTRSTHYATNRQVFDQHIVDAELFNKDPAAIIANPNLVVRLPNGHLYPWAVAMPHAIARLSFGPEGFDVDSYAQRILNQDERQAAEESCAAQPEPSVQPGWFGERVGSLDAATWWPRGTPVEIDDAGDSMMPLPVGSDASSVDVAPSEPSDKDSEASGLQTPPPELQSKPQHVKSLKPSQEALECLELKEGTNTIKFIAGADESNFVTARIFVWPSDSKIVISDVDGTITKSDIMGHVMTFCGQDWSHSGVTSMYNAVCNNGYRILYLTSRAIGMATSTRAYINTLKRDDITLPPGPVIMSPDRLFYSLAREVILRRPQEFKISALRDVRSLFPDDTAPFYAGFGNRHTDSESYESVGIPKGKIFIINPKSEITSEHGIEISKGSYTSMCDRVDTIFPPVGGDSGAGDAGAEEFNDVNFWRAPLPEI